WDWVILPTLSALTICFLVASMNYISKRHFLEAGHFYGSCLIIDGANGSKGVPNSVCWRKQIESEPVEYKFNSCGHRTAGDCGKKDPEVYRIVLVGSSFGMGEQVSMSKTFAAILQNDLSEISGRRVEVYNEALD